MQHVRRLAVAQLFHLRRVWLADFGDPYEFVIVDTDGNASNPMRKALRPRGFTWVLIGKDGTVKLRKPHPWTTRELGRVIDKMPLRQQEMRQRWEK